MKGAPVATNPNDTHRKTVGYLLWIFGFTGAHYLVALDQRGELDPLLKTP